jgi:hypothetical protein
MKIAPRIASAALAVAAIVAMPFVQATPVAAEYSAPEFVVKFARLAGPHYDNGLQGAEFAIRNMGTAPSNTIVAVPVCGYWKFKVENQQVVGTVHYEKQMPLITRPALPKGFATTILVQCPRDEGMAPEKVTLKVVAQPGELRTEDNQDSTGL